MSIAMVLKIFSDCCICFALLGSGPVEFPIPLLLPALICGVSAGIATFAHKKQWRFLQWLCGLLPAVCLLFVKDSMQVLLIAIPAGYTAFMIFRGKLELEYYGYRRFFMQSLGLLGGAYVLSQMWIFLSAAAGEPAEGFHPDVILRYGLVHLMCGVTLQRQLRLGVDHTSKSNRQQMASILLTGGVIAVGFVTAEPFLREQFLEVLKYVLLLLGIPVMIVLELVGKLIDWLSEFREKNPDVIIGEPVTTPGIGGGGTGVPDATGIPEREETAVASLDPTLVWGIVVAVLLVITAIILYRSFQKQRLSGDVGKIKISVVDPPKKKRPPRMSGRHKVRQLYRDFLRAENRWGLKLKKNDTSADVLKRIHQDTDKESAAALRQVYLSARYDDRGTISREQVNAAKQALKGTKSVKK